MCSMSAGSVNSKETESSNSLNEQYRIALLSPDGTGESDGSSGARNRVELAGR